MSGLVNGNKVQLPSDCREVQSLRIANGGLYTEIHPLPPARLADTLTTAFPVGYVTVNGVLQLIGGSGSPAYTMTYWQEIPDLATAPMNRNWLIQREPGLYLYGALLEASPYVADDARAIVWATQYRDILEGMQKEDDRARYGNAPAISPGRVP